MFKDDLFKGGPYYSLKGGLTQIILKLEEILDQKKNVTIIKECSLKEVYSNHIITVEDDQFNFKNLILTIPSEKIEGLEYFKDNELIRSVKPFPLLRIYAQYSTTNLWFKDIKRTITDNYIRQIIPIDYDKGLIMLSYTDDIYSKMWESYGTISNTFLIKALHKEIQELFDIQPPKPKMISTHYWDNGIHMWKTGYDIDEVYKSLLKPNGSDNIYIAGESFSKKQGWIEGSLETSYDVIKMLDLNGIKAYSSKSNINIKLNKKGGVEEGGEEDGETLLLKNKSLKKYSLKEVNNKKNWIILDHNGKLPIYNLSEWIKRHPGGDIIKKGIEANNYYDITKRKMYPRTPYDIFNSLHSKEVFDKYILNENQFIKQMGYLNKTKV